MIGRLRRAAEQALRLAAFLSFVAPLLTRIALGHAFYVTGRGKLENFGNAVAFFADLGIPLPEVNAAFVARLEYYGGLALIAGLLTRVFALGLASTMMVALMTADREAFLKAISFSPDVGLTDVTPVVFLLFLTWLVLFGAGAASADQLLSKFLRLGRPQPQSPAATKEAV